MLNNNYWYSDYNNDSDWTGSSQWPTFQRNKLLISDASLIQRTVNRGWGRGAGLHAHRFLWLDASHSRCSSLAVGPVTRALVSPLLAPFGVHAQGRQAGTSPTVWSLSEIDKIGGVFTPLRTFRRKLPGRKLGLKKKKRKKMPLAFNAYVRRFLRPAKINITEINAVKVFPSAD